MTRVVLQGLDVIVCLAVCAVNIHQKHHKQTMGEAHEHHYSVSDVFVSGFPGIYTINTIYGDSIYFHYLFKAELTFEYKPLSLYMVLHMVTPQEVHNNYCGSPNQ